MIEEQNVHLPPRVVERAPEVAQFLAGEPGWVVKYANWLTTAVAAALLVGAALLTIPVERSGRFTFVVVPVATEVYAGQAIDQDRMLVKSGEYVERGQVIATANGENISFDRMLYLEDILSTVNSSSPLTDLAALNIPANLSVGSLDPLIDTFLTAQSRFQTLGSTKSGAAALREAFISLRSQVRDWKASETLVSPLSGTITLADIADGAVYHEGRLIATVDPGQLAKIQAVVRLAAVDAVGIRLGDPVTLERDGYPASRFGVMIASISRIRTPDQGVVEIELIILETPSGRSIQSVPTTGVPTGTARITIGRRSLLNSLFSAD